MAKLGRPKKYDSDLKAKTLLIPELLLAHIEGIAGEDDKSVNETIVGMITVADPHLYADFMKRFDDVLELKKGLVEQNKLLEKLVKTNPLELWADINEVSDEIIDKVVEENKHEFLEAVERSGKTQFESAKNWHNLFLDKIEEEAIKQNKIVKDKRTLRRVLTHKLTTVGV